MFKRLLPSNSHLLPGKSHVSIGSIYSKLFPHQTLQRRTFSSFKDPYSVLGLNKDASSTDIKKSYFELVKKYHPDTNKDPEAKTKFIEIQNAYEILSDPKRKSIYDQYGATEEHATSGSDPSSGFHGYSGFGGGGGMGFDPNDIFKNIFSGGFRTGDNGGFDIFGSGNGFNQPSLDLVYQINLSFMEAVKGTRKTISFSRLEKCAVCNGKGVTKGSKILNCKTCNGTGMERKVRGSFIFSQNCRTCGGEGQINPNPCQPCQGTGSAPKTVTIDIEIPPGAADGQQFTIRGEGSQIGGERGNLFVNVSVSKSDLFIRKKNDIYVVTPISLYQAIAGGTVLVPTIQGDVEMKITPGTQSDDIKRISGRGVVNPETGEKGHHYVKIKVEIPRNLSAEQLELLKKALNPTDNTSSSSTSKGSEDENPLNDSFSASGGIKKWFSKLAGFFK